MDCTKILVVWLFLTAYASVKLMEMIQNLTDKVDSMEEKLLQKGE